MVAGESCSCRYELSYDGPVQATDLCRWAANREGQGCGIYPTSSLLNVGAILIMVLKDIKKNYVLLDLIRMPVFLLYICAFLFDVAGVKNYGRHVLISLVKLLKTRGGIQEIYRIIRYPGYISPYDDSSEWFL